MKVVLRQVPARMENVIAILSKDFAVARYMCRVISVISVQETPRNVTQMTLTSSV